MWTFQSLWFQGPKLGFSSTMEGMLNKAKEAIFKQYEEVLPRVTKATSFYRPDVVTPNPRWTDNISSDIFGLRTNCFHCSSSLQSKLTVSHCSHDCSVLVFSPPTLSLTCPISLSRQATPVSCFLGGQLKRICYFRWGPSPAHIFRLLTCTAQSFRSLCLKCSRTRTGLMLSCQAHWGKDMRFTNFGMKITSAALYVDSPALSTSTSPSPPPWPACPPPSPGSPSQSQEGSWLWKTSRLYTADSVNDWKSHAFTIGFLLLGQRWRSVHREG